MKRTVNPSRRIVWLVCLSFLSIFLVSGGSEAADKKLFRLGSASLGSSGYVHWEACAFLTNKYSPNLKASSLSTGGSTEATILLDQGKLELAHGTALEVVAAFEGSQPFKKKMEPWQVFSWTVFINPMVTLANSGLKTYYDLKGKPVSLIKKGAGIESFYQIVLEEYGVLKDIKKNYLSFEDSKDALIDGLIAAFPSNFSGYQPQAIMIELASRAPYRILETDPEVMKKANQRNKGIATTILPKTAYEGMTKDTLCPAFFGMGLSSAAVDDDTIYSFTKAVLDHIDELHSISKVSNTLTLENSTKWLVPGYPVHPGAVRYFKEKGVWLEGLVVGKR